MYAEKASIDEAYLDFTQPVRDLITERNPHLASVPEGSPLGLDTPLPDPPLVVWDTLGNVIPVLAPKEKAAESADSEVEPPNPPSSSQIEVPSDPVNAWNDYSLALAAELMQKCRTDVLQQLGYTCSAGVARNKVRSRHTSSIRPADGCFKILAKLCSAYRKPNAQVSALHTFRTYLLESIPDYTTQRCYTWLFKTTQVYQDSLARRKIGNLDCSRV